MTSIQTAAAQQRANVTVKVGRWDFVAIGFFFVLVATAGFGPSLVNPTHRIAPLTPLVSIHGILFSGWVLLYLAQAALIATGRRALHRRLGVASIVLAAIMVVTGYETAIALTRRGFDLSGDLQLGDQLKNLVFPLGDLVTFVTLLSAGLWYRRRPETHKRLMLLATTGMMMPASVAHFVGHNFPSVPAMVPVLLAILFIAPATYDRFRFGRFHHITLWGGILLFVWGNVRAFIIGPIAEWKKIAVWLIS
jgi:hypothetical protein